MSIIRDVTIKAKSCLNDDKIILFVGARQSGKTTILKQLQAFLRESGQITHFLNLEDPDYHDLLNKSPKNLFKIFTLDLNKKPNIFFPLSYNVLFPEYAGTYFSYSAFFLCKDYALIIFSQVYMVRPVSL